MGILKFIGVVNTGNAVKVVLISGLSSICLAVEIFLIFIDVISPDQLLMLFGLLFGLFFVGVGLVSAGIGMFSLLNILMLFLFSEVA